MTQRWTHPQDQKPRLLLLDDDASTLEGFAAQFEAQGFEVIPMHLGVAGANVDLFQHINAEEAVKYALRPGARIDAVVTNIQQPDFPYGLHLIKELHEKGFNGPVAAQERTEELFIEPRVKQVGGIGLFDKKHPEQTAEALHEALKSISKHR